MSHLEGQQGQEPDGESSRSTGATSSVDSGPSTRSKRKVKDLPPWPSTASDTLLGEYPHTQFDPESKEFGKFQRIRSCTMARGGVIDWDLLEEFKLKDRAISLLGGEDTPWTRLYDQDLDAHREISVEFLCTFRYTLHGLCGENQTI
jgi:hypothetical protein